MMMMMNKKMKMMSSSWSLLLLLLSSSSSNYLFNLLHEDLIIDEILLKLPVSSLLRLRCVSRYFHSLITSPSFIKKHLHHSSADDQLLILSRLSGPQNVIEHYACNNLFSTTTGDDGDDLSRSLRLQFEKMHCPVDQSTCIQASCNGLLFLHKFFDALDSKMERGYIWNPCTKEYKEVLPPSRVEEHLFEGIQLLGWLFVGCPPCGVSGFGGFGYDCTKDEYKILYYEFRVGHLPRDPDPDHLVSIIEFKVYNLGTNTWTRISSHNNPCRRLFFGQLWKRIGLFTNGALHWIMSSSYILSSSKYGLYGACARDARIISFCMEKEEFREIQKPYHSSGSGSGSGSGSATTTDQEEEVYYGYGDLQELQGCLCLCECPIGFNKVDIWMLKDYAKDSSWTKLYTVMITKDWNWRYGPHVGLRCLQLLRLFENDEIVMTRDYRMDMFVYDTVKHTSRPFENLNLDKAIIDDDVIRERWTNEVIYVKSLVSLNSGTYMS